MEEAIKRSNLRYHIDLEVKVDPKDGTAFRCKVRDYCLSGMFLNLLRDDDAPLSAASITKSTPITIEFSSLNEKRQRIAAQVAHTESGGFGVRFTNISDEALNALLEIATQQQAQAEEGLMLAGDWQSQGRAGLMLLLKDTLQRHMISLFNTFHETLVDVIFERASRPRNINEQNDMFEALDHLNKQRTHSFQRIYNEIVETFDAFTSGKKRSSSRIVESRVNSKTTGLSLIDDRDFEEWLWASTTVARLEAEHEEEMFGLNQRLSSLQGPPLDNESNPVGAAVICHTFQDLIRDLDIADSVRQLVITTFQQIIEERFGALINEFNHHLIQRGILPEVKRDMKIVRLGFNSSRETVEPIPIEIALGSTRPQTRSFATPQARAKHTGSPSSGTEASVAASSMTAPDSIAPEVHAPTISAPVISRPHAAAPAGNTHSGGEHSTLQAGSSGANGFASGLAQVRNLLRSITTGTVSDPLTARPAHRHLPSETTGINHDDGKTEVSGGWYGTSELTSALTSIESQISTIRANRDKGDSILAQLKASLSRMGGDPNKAIPVEKQESIEIIDKLMDSVHEDPIVATEVRPWLEQLEVPLLKTVIRDESLIDNRDHPATHFLNRLDMIGKSLSNQANERTHAVRKEISTLIDQVKDKSDSDDTAFDQALSRLEDLHDSMRRQYETSVAELVRLCDEEYLFDSKREALIKLLDEHFEGVVLPVIVFEVLDTGWKNLLLRSFVREGPEGKIFRRFLEVIDQTIARLTSDMNRVKGKLWPDNTLLELIPRGLRQVPVGDEQIERLMIKLEPQFAMASVAPESLAKKPMPRLSELTEEKRRRQQESLMDTLKVTRERWGKAEDSIRSLRVGDMITIIDADGKKHGHKLIWIAPNQSRFVFVDGEGHLSYDIALNNLVSLLLEEKASILEGWDVPLMDRATYSMLLSIHNKLISQSNNDALTGLQNRRAFELDIEKALERTRIDKTKNILCYLDLDHFSLVNSLCTHEEGDRVLKDIAQLLRQHAPDNSLIGRLGGDEFALLMPDMSRTEGLVAVRGIQQAMHAYKSHCKSHAHSQTASFGLVEINELSESGTRLMTSVETACRTAKENGRNRIEIHHKSNDHIARREGLIDMAGHIDEAIENHRMQLVCQRILPLTSRDIEQAPYYEILLRVHDADGQPISHEQFIQAAEMYNRTLDVDHWVVHSVVDWLEQRHSAGKQLPIVSVNLSGRSVNNKEFMDIIAERISQCSIPRNHLCLEITETAAIGDMGQATHFINRIKRIGCGFSLDDFGTGISSYSYLKALPVDYIKIDGSFVRNCHQQPHDLAVIKSINELGHAMGKKTIAEYVENEDILSRLHEIGVDYAQGYGIEKPVPITQLN